MIFLRNTPAPHSSCAATSLNNCSAQGRSGSVRRGNENTDSSTADVRPMNFPRTAFASASSRAAVPSVDCTAQGHRVGQIKY